MVIDALSTAGIMLGRDNTQKGEISLKECLNVHIKECEPIKSKEVGFGKKAKKYCHRY